jgi:hypothetical protein
MSVYSHSIRIKQSCWGNVRESPIFFCLQYCWVESGRSSDHVDKGFLVFLRLQANAEMVSKFRIFLRISHGTIRLKCNCCQSHIIAASSCSQLNRDAGSEDLTAVPMRSAIIFCQTIRRYIPKDELRFREKH